MSGSNSALASRVTFCIVYCAPLSGPAGLGFVSTVSRTFRDHTSGSANRGAFVDVQQVELCGVNTGPSCLCFPKRKSGDRQARQEMVEGNLRLVLSVVQRFARRGENLDDLFQVGCIGLIKAIDNFDPAQPVRFSTYGVPMIIGEIRRFLRDNNALRVSRTLRDPEHWKSSWARAHRRRDRRPGQGSPPGSDRGAGIGGGADQPGRAGVHRWRRCDVCHRSGAGPGRRGQLDQRAAVPADRSG